MRELGVLGNANYKLVCMLDHKAMLTVQTEKYGVFDCKPLQFIWAKVGASAWGAWEDCSCQNICTSARAHTRLSSFRQVSSQLRGQRRGLRCGAPPAVAESD